MCLLTTHYNSGGQELLGYQLPGKEDKVVGSNFDVVVHKLNSSKDRWTRK